MPNQQKYLEEAIRIGDSILDRAIIEDNKCWWKTLEVSSDGNNQIAWNASESLYSGVSGISYFLMELHRATEDDKYGEILVKTANWLEWYCSDNPTDYYAFYTGRLGVAFLFLKLAEHFKDEKYLHKALKVSEGCNKFLERQDTICDLINGVSGALLGLLHIHDKTKNERILSSIKKFTAYIIDHFQATDKGIYWDRSPKNIQGLCGFSHGASGIGYVLLELGQYFQNPTFQLMAAQAFSYENAHFDTLQNNWPDFRRGFYTEATYKQHEEAYFSGNRTFFFEKKYMSAWCHGAPGIGLSRVRAAELNIKEYLGDLNNALSHVKKTDLEEHREYVSYTLCHGLCGNAFLFLESNRVLHEKKYLEWSQKIGDYAIDFLKKHNTYLSGYSQAGSQEDLSLFMGNAGIGLFMVYLSENGISKASIMKPDVANKESFYDHYLSEISVNDVFKSFSNQFFPKTVEKLANRISFKSQGQLSEIPESTIKYIEKHINKNREYVALFEYEKTKFFLYQSIKNDSYHYLSQQLEIERNQKIISSGSDINALTLKFPETYQIVKDPIQLENRLLLIPSFSEVSEVPITDFLYTLLSKFEKACAVGDALDLIVSDFDENSSEQEVRSFSSEQIREVMLAGLLIQPS